jgi:intracellular sulfur oxidation DsrE/DsrF family protein
MGPSRKRLRTWLATVVGLALALPGAVAAGPEDFSTGPLIQGYGPAAGVDVTMPLPKDTVFHIAFDAERGAEDGALNQTLNSAARFMNMQAAHGVPAENLHLAVVIHGSAVTDVSTASAGPNAGLVTALQTHGVRLIVCGQSAAYRGVTNEDLLPGVEMALSAMTAHAVLQQDGYTLNPF